MSRIRVHSSTKEILLDSGLQDRRHTMSNGLWRKPTGFWWSFGSMWPDLVTSGRSKAAKTRGVGGFHYVVEIADTTRILRLASWEQLLDFTETYGSPMPWGRGFHWQTKDSRDSYDASQDDVLISGGHCRVPLIDWTSVEREWDGIELEPELFSVSRPRMEWLDIDWDVPSGCAWRVHDLRLEGPLSLIEVRERAESSYLEDCAETEPRSFAP